MEWGVRKGRALVTEDGEVAYRELGRLVDRRAADFAAAGITAGEPVVLCLPNGIGWVAAYLALAKIGAVSVPLDAASTAEEVAYVLESCKARVAFVPEALSRALAGRFGDTVGWWPDGRRGGVGRGKPRADLGDTATIAYTAGTTGRPKGALQTRTAVRLGGESPAARLCLAEGEVVVTALPLAHSYGTSILNAVLTAGSTLAVRRRFSEADLLALTLRGAGVLTGVPAMYRRLLAHEGAWALSGLRCAVSAGQSAGASLAAAVEERTGGAFVEGWGMTELAGFAALAAPKAEERTTCGTAMPQVGLRVAAPGQDGVGELEVTGPMVTPGYLDDPEKTAELIGPDGWLRTGDLGSVDEHGRVRIAGRVRDVIVTGGHNVYPAEVERVVAAHPGVAQVAVAALRDPVRGEIACAWIVPRQDREVTAEEIVAHCRPHLAVYKLPRRTVFVDALPLLPNGKVARAELTDLT